MKHPLVRYFLYNNITDKLIEILKSRYDEIRQICSYRYYFADIHSDYSAAHIIFDLSDNFLIRHKLDPTLINTLYDNTQESLRSDHSIPVGTPITPSISNFKTYVDLYLSLQE